MTKRGLWWLSALLVIGGTAGATTTNPAIGGYPYHDGGGNTSVDPQFVSLTPGAGFLVVGTASPAAVGAADGSPQGAHMGDTNAVARRLLDRLTAVAALGQQTPTP